MGKFDGKVTRYRVTWHLVGQDRKHVSPVLITEGYSTTKDIPKILAIARLTGADDAPLVMIDSLVKETD